MTKTVEKPYPMGPHIPIYKGAYPPPALPPLLLPSLGLDYIAVLKETERI